MDTDEHAAIAKAFRDAVNMTPAAIDKWLQTAESHEVGWTHEGENESVGHHMGRRIVEIRHTKKTDYTEDDYAVMQKVAGYIHRHMAQRPQGDVTETRWRYSLMNWGHDPLQS